MSEHIISAIGWSRYGSFTWSCSAHHRCGRDSYIGGPLLIRLGELQCEAQGREENKDRTTESWTAKTR